MKQFLPVGLFFVYVMSVIAVRANADGSTVVNSTSAPGSTSIRVVGCDEPVQSRKRGLCANKLSSEDIKALAPGVSWFYNWHFTTENTVPDGVHFDYLPMVWGHEGDDDLKGIDAYLASHAKPRAVLAINEPNISGQAYITPEATAALYKKVKAIADKYQVPVVGPNMALGSLANGSIKAMDPFEKKEVLYGAMTPFLKATMHFMGDVEVPAMALHSYGNLGELKWAPGEMNKQFQKDVWVTEYARWNAGSPHEALDYLVRATDFLERTPYVKGYAWFKERLNDTSINNLLGKNPGELTAMGRAYVSLPVHDADLYYRIPGKLEAARYVALQNAEIEMTNDTGAGSSFDMSALGPATLDYNVQVDKAGRYTLDFRISGPPGDVEILENDQPLATVAATTRDWSNVKAEVQLPSGPQTLRIRIKGQTLHWIEFAQTK